MPWGVYFHDILGFVAPTRMGEKLRQPTKIQKYPPKLLPLLEGMTCSVDIILALIRLKFEEHDLLLLKDVQDDPYKSFLMVLGAPI